MTLKSPLEMTPQRDLEMALEMHPEMVFEIPANAKRNEAPSDRSLK